MVDSPSAWKAGMPVMGRSQYARVSLGLSCWVWSTAAICYALANWQVRVDASLMKTVLLSWLISVIGAFALALVGVFKDHPRKWSLLAMCVGVINFVILIPFMVV